MICLAISALGCLFFREPAESTVLARPESVDDDDLCISAWTLAEMASVGAIRERTGHIDAAGGGVGLAAFYRFVSDSLTLSEVEPTDFRTAAVLLDTPALALRAGDALHIAIARRIGASLATLSAQGVENYELWKKVERILRFSIRDLPPTDSDHN